MSEYKNCPPDVDYIAVPGERGPQGVQGPQGERGPAGPEGKQGPQGLQGIEGCRGPKGDRGPRGEKGDPGRDGRDGAPGPQGPQGLEGPRGCTGAVKWSSEITPQQIEQLRGPKGPKGDQGPRGFQGIPGLRGPQGIPGLDGATGPQGPVGPAGPQGARGPKGDIGPRGGIGPMGPAGGATIVDHIHDGAVWSSKTVADYSLHGKVDWTEKKIGWTKEEGTEISAKDTENGYIRNLKVMGRTLTNLSTLRQGYECDILDKEHTHEDCLITIFDASSETVDALKNISATILFNVKPTRGNDQVLGDAYAEVFKTMTDLEGRNEIKIKTVAQIDTNGNVKEFISAPSDHKITKIEVRPYTHQLTEGERGGQVLHVSFLASKFMIIKGDWRNTMLPEYFWGTKGVGAKTREEEASKGVYKIELESRNKNLINLEEIKPNCYIGENEMVGEHDIYRWHEKDVSTSRHATFLIYCKPSSTYTFSCNIKDKSKARFFVLGYHETPTNGEIGEMREFVPEMQLRNGEFVKSFNTGINTNVLAIYIANIGEDITNKKKLLERIGQYITNIQLEEGIHSTTYEPYLSIKKTLYLPQQLKDNEYLYWKNERQDGNQELLGQYWIHPASGADIPTPNDSEQLIHTYDKETYVYIRSKIPSVIMGDFPIKAHTDYYTVEEVDEKINDFNESEIKAKYFPKTDFIFNDVAESEDLNFLRLPSKSGNSFIMQWKEISVTNGMDVPTVVPFPSMSSILSAQATVYIEGDHNLPTPQEAEWICPIIMKEHAGMPTLKVYANAPQHKSIKVLLMVIGRGTRVE